jgi:hypothetical protein
MRTANPLHNPFSNRFNEPCRRRVDEMQSAEHMAWLREREVFERPTQHSTKTSKPGTSGGWLRTVAALFGLLVLIVTVGVFATSF